MGVAYRAPVAAEDSRVDMEQPPKPPASDAPTLVPEDGSSAGRSRIGAQTLTPPPSSSDSPTLLPDGSSTDAPTLVPESSSAAQTASGASRAPDAWAAAGLQPGTVLGGRYEILQALGEGGMGTVYKARDRELDRLVALKVIRPDLARNPAIIQRFKQELILARQVTHRNVIRIFDLGEADGVKFITMEFIEGQDLRSLLLEHKKFSPEEAVEVIRQVCLALDAAHSEGVIHRDLKPQNIMRDVQGRIVVMDFGLARSLQSDGMTQTGALIGTMEYMSPEQGLGQELDQRSDLFTLGLIFYELLTGQVPYKADSALASLLKRTQERAVPVSDLEGAVPRVLSNIVARCLERDPKLRYATARELLSDLEAWQGKSAAASIRLPAVHPWAQDVPWAWITVLLVAAILAGTGYLLRGKLFAPSGSQQAAVKPEISLAILPFRNASGDASLAWLGPSLADMLGSDIGQSAHLRTVSPDRLHQVLSDLKIAPDTALDPTTLRRVAESSSADTLVWGQYARFGDQIRIDATLRDLKHDRTISLHADSPSVQGVPGAVDRLADSVRHNLSVSSNVLAELRASSFQPSSKSIDALRDYNQGVELARDGKNLDALTKLQAATKEDPQFALAYSRLAQTYSALGYDNEAEQASQRAVDLSGSLPIRERYLILASHARIANDYQKAIQFYEDLAKVSPSDLDVQFALGQLYETTKAYDKAAAHYNNVLQRDPQSIDAVLAMGRVENGLSDLQRGLGFFNQAYNLAVQVNNDEEKAASLQAIGVTFRLMGKNEEALRNYQQSLAIKRRLGQQGGIAASLYEIAKVQVLLGSPQAALSSFNEALQIRRSIGDKAGVADTLIDLGNFYDDRGDHDQGLKLYKEALQTERDIHNESLEAICLNNIGSIYFEKAQYEDAQIYYQQALQLREKAKVPEDIVETVHNLAETSAKMGQYDDAVTQYMRALELRRQIHDARGAAIESYSIGTLFDLQGRLGAAVTSKQDALKTFRDLKDKTFWMGEVLGGYGEALVLAGRGTEAGSYLDEALSLSRQLKNDALLAQTLNFQGDNLFYRGDFQGAKALYERALQTAARGKENEQTLIARTSLAKVAVAQRRSQQAINTLRPLCQQSEDQGLKYVAVECSISMGEALLQIKNYAQARQELERALVRAGKLGLQPLAARANYLLASVLRASGDLPGAQEHYRDALRILDAIQKDPGADKALQRSDFAAIYSQSSHWVGGAKS